MERSAGGAYAVFLGEEEAEKTTEEASDDGEKETGSSSSDHIAARKKAGEWWSEQDVEAEEFRGSGTETAFRCFGRCCVAESTVCCCCCLAEISIGCRCSEAFRESTHSARSWARHASLPRLNSPMKSS